MRNLILFAIPMLLTACPDDSNRYNFQGTVMNDYFPLDGDRSWTYTQLQDDIAWKLRVEKVPQTVWNGSTEIVTLEYYNDETGDLLYSVDWSSGSSTGVQVWGWSDELTGEGASYDPPVQIAEKTMLTNDTTETETGGQTFTATFHGKETCSNDWRADWECVKVEVDDGDGDPMSGPPFAGTWWMATSWGTSRFIPTGYTDAWVLSSATFDELE